MSIEIRVPEVGESISEGRLVEWLVADGATVALDQPLFELETDKITMSVSSPGAGRLLVRVAAGATVLVGQVVGVLDPALAGAQPDEALLPSAGGAEASAGPVSGPRSVDADADAEADPDQGPPLHPPAGWPQAASKLAAEALADLAPAVRRLVLEHGLDPARLPATGRGGRLTKEDVLAALGLEDERGEPPPPVDLAAARAADAAAPLRSLHRVAPPPGTVPPSSPMLASASAAAIEPTPPPFSGDAAASPLPFPAPSAGRGAQVAAPGAAGPGGPRQTRKPLSPLRQRIAERLVLAQQNAAILTTFNEADCSAVLALREQHGEVFQKKHGVRLGMMSFFVKAVVDALRTVPELNSRIEGDQIVTNHFYDIGVAVGTEQGLIVPVLRDADQLSFAGIEQQLAELAQRARQRTLTLADLTGGCFTISNGGVYGSLLSTPILNPPQSGILGMHAIKKRPVVVQDQIVVRPMMYLALSYDHRLIDGREAVTFLRRVVDCLEAPQRMMLEI